ncbi:hypothetical protein BD779DRAFT_1683080 [Infundibulicybe gibba]|nr:hypothetical protein BD779DRAFT_1683080 [Infundibulicybe gibba]
MSQLNNSAVLQDILQPRPPLTPAHIPFQFDETIVQQTPFQFGDTNASSAFAQTGTLPQVGGTSVVLPLVEPTDIAQTGLGASSMARESLHYLGILLPGPGTTPATQLAGLAPFQYNGTPPIPPLGIGASPRAGATQQIQANLNGTPMPAPTQIILPQDNAAGQSQADSNRTFTTPPPTQTTLPQANPLEQSRANLNGTPTPAPAQATLARANSAERPQADVNGTPTPTQAVSPLAGAVEPSDQAGLNGIPVMPVPAHTALLLAGQSQADPNETPTTSASAQATPPQASVVEQSKLDSNGMPMTPASAQATPSQASTVEQSQTSVACPAVGEKRKRTATRPKPTKRKKGNKGPAAGSGEPKSTEQGNIEGESGAKSGEVADGGSSATVPTRRVPKLPTRLKDAGYKPPARTQRKK